MTTLPALLDTAAHRTPDRTFLHATSTAGPTALSFAELADRSRLVAAGLLARGIAPGDRIAIAAGNQVEWLELFFGATRIGAVVVTLNVRYREHELDYMLRHSGARLVVAADADGDTDLRPLYQQLRQRIPTLADVLFLGTGSPNWTELPADQPGDVEHVAQQTDPAMILYTSGTTGRPKGATLTHGGIAAAAAAQATHLGTTADDVFVGVMPLNHVGGITCTVTSALHAGATVALLPAFSPQATLTAIAEHRATIFAGVPTMWTLMLGHESFDAHDTSSLRTAIVGGSNADPALCRAITTGFGSASLRNLYGLSEVSGACVISAAGDDLDTVSRSIGVALPGIEVRTVDPDGAVVGPGAAGELEVRGPGAAAGYWDAPAETAATFGDDGWVATGDMATIEPDGHIMLRGRRKEMFVQGGYNVYPVEVENVLADHPAVAMVAGVGVPDPVLGEVGRYYVLCAPGQQTTEDELRTHCAGRLADYKVPRQIRFVDDLPLTPAGKIAKATLREQLAE